MKSYKQKNYEQALIETYLKFDELLRLDKVNMFLRNSLSSKRDSRLDITFSYGLEGEFGSMPKNLASVIKTEEAKLREEDIPVTSVKSSMTKNTGGNSENKKGVNIPKENIIDLTKREFNSPKTSSDASQKNSNDDKQSSRKSREILTLDNRKIEISLKNNPTDNSDSNNYDQLIAKDMGTTANIILIKNN
jgi:hypothetical protein